MEISINYWAVLAAAVANMLVGSLWYGPLFGKQWKKLMGFSAEDPKSMKMKASTAMVGGLVTALVTAYVLAHFADVWGALDTAGAFALAFWIWLGFVATTQLAGVLWEGRPGKLFFLYTLQSLVSLVVIAWILVAWL